MVNEGCFVHFSMWEGDQKRVHHSFLVTEQMYDQMVASCLAMADNADSLPEEWKVIKL